jgi:hypothetical protein
MRPRPPQVGGDRVPGPDAVERRTRVAASPSDSLLSRSRLGEAQKHDYRTPEPNHVLVGDLPEVLTESRYAPRTPDAPH